MWLDDDTSLIFYDMQTRQKVARKHLSRSGRIASFAVRTDRSAEDIKKAPAVIPSVLKEESISVRGDYDQFKIVWEPVSNVDGSVEYNVLCRVDHAAVAQFTTAGPEFDPRSQPVIKDVLMPHSRLEVKILPQTEWGKAEAVARRVLYAPETKPGRPQDVRAFYHTSAKTEVNFEIRWNPPRNPNGRLTGYLVEVSCERNAFCGRLIPAGPVDDRVNFTVPGEIVSESVRFSVKAATVLGRGEAATTSLEISDKFGFYSVPRLIVFEATQRVMKLIDVDVGVTIAERSVYQDLIGMKYSDFDRSVYYLSKDGEVGKLSLEGRSRTRLGRLNRDDNPTAFDFDFFSRYAYMAVPSKEDFNTTVFKMAVDQPSPTKKEAAAVVEGHVEQMAVDAYGNYMFYLSEDLKGRAQLRRINLRYGVETILGGGGNECDCLNPPLHRTVTSFVLRPTGQVGQFTVLVSVRSEDGGAAHVFKVSIPSCECNHVGTLDSDRARLTAADTSQIYLSDGRAMDYEGNVKELKGINGKNITLVTSYCPSCQIMPDPISCLSPRVVEPTAVTVNVTDISATLKLPSALSENRHSSSTKCSFSNALPPTTYLLHYMDLSNATHTEWDMPALCRLGQCVTIKRTVYHDTDATTVTVPDLRPYTRYGFYLKLENVYEKRDIKSDDGGVYRLVTVVETKEAAPTEPRNVTASPLTPTSVRVSWLPSEIANGRSVTYEVHYRMEDYLKRNVAQIPER